MRSNLAQRKRPTPWKARRLVTLVSVFGISALALPILLITLTSVCHRALIYTVEEAPPRSVAIVFGAGIWPGGQLSPILKDRVDTGIQLYQQGKVRKLLMTGDNRFLDYNEPQRMYEYAIDCGVPPEDIVRDYAGRRTYDSCYRARSIFRVQDAILVTQGFHLDRALFIARKLGIDAVGVAADRRTYQHIRRYQVRETLATTLAWWEVFITHPEPVLGEQLPIFPDEH